MSQLHLRSSVASSYFEDERKKVASFISGVGLRSDVWCFGAEAAGGFDVPIGVISRAGNTTLFLDAWIGRRERIDTPAKRYWQWRMDTRPLDVFLAQILQFQCQLSGVFKQQPPADGGDDDPCASTRTLIREASDTVAKIASFYETVTTRFTLQPLLVSDNASAAQPPVLEGGLATLLDFQKRLQAVSAAALIPSDKFLIDGGILELPSAGYLPVTPLSVISINEQVRRLLGNGLDLQFCVVRPDFVAHALEEAQHMERISLLQGLDAPNNNPEVDILVPNGEIIEQKRLSPGLGFEAKVAVNSALLIRQDTPETIPVFRGAARSEELASGGGAIYLSGALEPGLFATIDRPRPSGATDTATMNTTPLEAAAQAGVNQPSAGVWISLSCERNVFALERGDTSNVNARAVVGANQAGAAGNQPKSPRLDIKLNGVFEVTEEAAFTGTGRRLKGRFRDAQLSILGPAFGDTSQRRTMLVDLNATVTLTKESQIEILLEHEQNSVQLSANWGNKPLEAKGLISIKSNTAEGQEQGTPLAEASLKENEDVLSVKNDNHVSALQALEAVAAALGDVSFADAKARLLFPPPPKPTDELLVRGTRDWVLFHRRRTKHCSEEKLAPPLVQSRRYQVYQVLAQDDQEARLFRNLLLAGQFPANRLVEVGIVEYGGDVATLLTPAADIRKDWQIAKPGDTIIFGAIGNRASAAADGEALSLARLDRLEGALAPISKLAPRAQDDFLGNVPSSILAPGVDGVIVLITQMVIPATADLSLTKTQAVSTTRDGFGIAYQLRVTNNGPSDARDVTVTDPVPANTTFVSAASDDEGWTSTAPVGGTGVVVFSKALVESGEAAVLTIEVNVKVPEDKPAPVDISNTAMIKSSTTDPDPSNNEATVDTPLG